MGRFFLVLFLLSGCMTAPADPAAAVTDFDEMVRVVRAETGWDLVGIHAEGTATDDIAEIRFDLQGDDGHQFITFRDGRMDRSFHASDVRFPAVAWPAVGPAQAGAAIASVEGDPGQGAWTWSFPADGRYGWRVVECDAMPCRSWVVDARDSWVYVSRPGHDSSSAESGREFPGTFADRAEVAFDLEERHDTLAVRVHGDGITNGAPIDPAHIELVLIGPEGHEARWNWTAEMGSVGAGAIMRGAAGTHTLELRLVQGTLADVAVYWCTSGSDDWTGCASSKG